FFLLLLLGDAYRESGRLTRRHIVVAVVSVACCGVAAGVYVSSYGGGYGSRLIDRTITGRGKVEIDRAVLQDTFVSPRRAFIGGGPGDTVSRLAVLALPEQRRAGSPVEVLGISPTNDALRYQAAAAQLAGGGVSDLLAPGSSLIGLIGDGG